MVTHRAPDGTTADDMRKLALDVRGRLGGTGRAVVAIAGVPSDRPVVVVAVNEEARQAGLKAGELVGVAARRSAVAVAAVRTSPRAAAGT